MSPVLKTPGGKKGSALSSSLEMEEVASAMGKVKLAGAAGGGAQDQEGHDRVPGGGHGGTSSSSSMASTLTSTSKLSSIGGDGGGAAAAGGNLTSTLTPAEEEELEIMEPCKLTELIPAKSLAALVEEGARFQLTYYSPTTFTEYQVMREGVFENELFHLKEAMLEVVEPDLLLKRIPSLDDIVLAPISCEGRDRLYHRAVVVSADEQRGQVGVYFFDMGGFQTVDMLHLKPVTREIMGFPVLGYQIALQGFGSANFGLEQEKILVGDFENLMRNLKSLKFRVEIGEQSEMGGDFSDNKAIRKHEAILHCYPGEIGMELDKKNPKKEALLSDLIQRQGLWEWESLGQKFPEVRLTDNEIFKRNCSIEPEDLNVYSPEVGTSFTAQVSGVFASGAEDYPEGHLRIILLDDPNYMNNHRVLHHQMERYCETVEKSRFSPHKNQRMLFKMDNDKVYARLGLKSMGKWCRGLNIQGGAYRYYLYDWDETIAVDRLDSACFEVRRLPLEFAMVGSLVVEICPLEDGLPMSFSRVRERFQESIGERFSFKIIRLRADDVLLAELQPN